MGTDDWFAGTLEVEGDRDWVRVELTAGDGIQINLNGAGGFGELSDPYLYLLDSNGDVVAENDDFGGIDSQITYAITQTGTYYIEASGYADRETGDYEIITQEVTPPPPPSPLDSIAWGTAIDGDTPRTTDVETVNVYFATNGQTFDGYTSEGFNAYERGQILAMMDDLSDIVNLEFNVVNNASNADLTLVLDLNEISNETNPYLGYFNPPGENNEGVGVFNGDLWDRTAGGDLEQGGFGYVTIVHELMHGLGMAHPHDTGGSSVVMDGVSSNFGDYGDFDLNQGVFTVMTYNSGYFTGTAGSAPANPSGGNYGFEGGAMALDIAYLQLVYGANTSHAGGANTYTMADANESGTYWEAIWDTGGTDTIRHDGSEWSVIDLRAATLAYENGGGGFVSSVDGVAGGFTIANGVVIENAMGGFGRDTITGNAADNFLVGRGGSDTIFGGTGDDLLKGNNGNDRLVGGTGADIVRGGNGNDTLVGSGGNDNLIASNGDDIVRGGSGRDRLTGGRGEDLLNGGTGNDELIGGIKTDILIGGGGRDMLTGGGGADMFVFTSVAHSRGSKVDTITDFARGRDQIDVSGIDAVSGRGGNQEFDYIGSRGFSEAGQIRVQRDGSDVIVQADTNGDGNADFELVVQDVNWLSEANFIL